MVIGILIFVACGTWLIFVVISKNKLCIWNSGRSNEFFWNFNLNRQLLGEKQNEHITTTTFCPQSLFRSAINVNIGREIALLNRVWKTFRPLLDIEVGLLDTLIEVGFWRNLFFPLWSCSRHKWRSRHLVYFESIQAKGESSIIFEILICASWLENKNLWLKNKIFLEKRWVKSYSKDQNEHLDFIQTFSQRGFLNDSLPVSIQCKDAKISKHV